MKKLTKIFATVLTLAMAVSTVVMPVSANYYAGSVANYTFTEDGVAGMAGKDASDKVKAAPFRPMINGANGGCTTNSTVFTYEASLYPASGSSNFLKIILQNSSNYNNNLRFGVRVYGNGNVQKTLATSESFGTVEGVTANVGKWNKVAIEVDQANDTMKWYLNGALIATVTNAGLANDGKFNTDMNITGTGYIDNMRMYPAPYDPANDTVPAAAGALSFLDGGMTVAEAKALALATQTPGTAAAHVYKDGVGGTEAADTEKLVKGWRVVITSLSGDMYRADGIYTVEAALDCTGVTFADNTVTATVVNNANAPVPSMMMVLVEGGGKFIMSSAVQTNIEDTATFTITGVDTLSAAEVFFVESWADLAPVMDVTFDVE